MRGFALDDYSDRELLALIHDLGDEDGWVLASDVARAVGFAEPEVHGRRSVSIRFAWMRRYGALIKHETSRPAMWRLSDAGERIRTARLDIKTLQAIHGAGEASLLYAAHTLAGRMHEATGVYRALTRRELQRELRR